MPPASLPPVTGAAADANDEVTATIYHDLTEATADGSTAIVAVEHHALSTPPSAATETSLTDIDPSLMMPSREKQEGEEPFTATIAAIEPDDVLPFATAAPIPEEVDEGDLQGEEKNASTDQSDLQQQDPDEKLSASMQSLIDGLMSWGGAEPQEDHFALPAGMAASIALEESVAMGTQKPA